MWEEGMYGRSVGICVIRSMVSVRSEGEMCEVEGGQTRRVYYH